MLQGDPGSVGQHLSHMKLAGYNQHVAVPAEELQQASFLRRGFGFWIVLDPDASAVFLPYMTLNIGVQKLLSARFKMACLMVNMLCM